MIVEQRRIIMASLAFMAAFVLLFVVFIGPTVYILSWIKIIPSFIVFLFGVISIFVGIWWIFLPLGFIQFLGIFPVILGISAINIRIEDYWKGKKHE
jgi:hypothetical protein